MGFVGAGSGLETRDPDRAFVVQVRLPLGPDPYPPPLSPGAPY